MKIILNKTRGNKYQVALWDEKEGLVMKGYLKTFKEEALKFADLLKSNMPKAELIDQSDKI